MPKPRLFIGSTKESLDLAYTAQKYFEGYAEAKVWDQGVFKLTQYALESLIDALDSFDFGLFILAADDIVRIRGVEHATVRDNIIFELGLFIGRLGKDRSFMIRPTEPSDLRLPTDLLGINFATFEPDREDGDLRAALGPACHTVRHLLATHRSSIRARGLQSTPKLATRDEFTDYLLSGLRKPQVSRITLVTYTAEVDSSLLSRYHNYPSKEIDIYKRSILTDLAEQQECNMRRLAAGSPVKHWNKRKISMRASRALAEESSPTLKISQFLYAPPPTKRVYMLDDAEAMWAYYEVIENPREAGGSIYRGITKSPATIVNRSDSYGAFVLDETRHFVAALKRVSRSWEEEREILLKRASWSGHGKRPCIEPRAVFFDVDGVLLDSLPLYVVAWREAFAQANIAFADATAYYEEGRKGVETIRLQLRDAGFSEIDEKMVASIHARKREIFHAKGPAPLQKGAKELVERAANSGLDIWVVTGSSDAQIGARLEQEFSGLIKAEKVVTNKDARAGKPHPDPFLLACSKAGVHPHEGIAIENAPLGIKSADAAGLFCLAVNSGILKDCELEAAGARAVFPSCGDLAAKWTEVVTILRE